MSKYQNIVSCPYSTFFLKKGIQSLVIIYWWAFYVPDPVLAKKKRIARLFQAGGRATILLESMIIT